MKWLCLLLLFGMTAASAQAGKPPHQKQTTWRDRSLEESLKRRMEALREPDRVTLYRVARNTEDEKMGRKETLQDPVVLNRQQAERLSKLLLAKNALCSPPIKGCAMMPGIVAVFFKAGEAGSRVFRPDVEIKVRFCFECGMLSMNEDDMFQLIFDFDPVYKPLAAFMQSVYPQDKALETAKGEFLKAMGNP